MKYLLLGLFLAIYIFLLHSTTPSEKIDPILKLVCTEQARINARGWEETEFKDFDWYTSCVDNIRYTSPLARR